MEEVMAYGVGQAARPARPWWQSEAFPLVPRLFVREGDAHNTKHVSLTWLCFHWWLLDDVGLGFDAKVDTGYSSRFWAGVTLPYMRFGIQIPLPLRWMRRFHREPVRK